MGLCCHTICEGVLGAVDEMLRGGGGGVVFHGVSSGETVVAVGGVEQRYRASSDAVRCCKLGVAVVEAYHKKLATTPTPTASEPQNTAMSRNPICTTVATLTPTQALTTISVIPLIRTPSTTLLPLCSPAWTQWVEDLRALLSCIVFPHLGCEVSFETDGNSLIATMQTTSPTTLGITLCVNVVGEVVPSIDAVEGSVRASILEASEGACGVRRVSPGEGGEKGGETQEAQEAQRTALLTTIAGSIAKIFAVASPEFRAKCTELVGEEEGGEKGAMSAAHLQRRLASSVHFGAQSRKRGRAERVSQISQNSQTEGNVPQKRRRGGGGGGGGGKGAEGEEGAKRGPASLASQSLMV